MAVTRIYAQEIHRSYSETNGRRRPRSERELAPIRADIGMVFQLFNLFPHLTAAENVMLGLSKVRGVARKQARESAEHWLSRVVAVDHIGARWITTATILVLAAIAIGVKRPAYETVRKSSCTYHLIDDSECLIYEMSL